MFSKRFFLANLALTGGIIGFSLSALVFSCSTQIQPGDTAQAQESDSEMEVDVQGLENSFRRVAEAVRPSVVKVTVSETRTQEAPDGGRLPFFDFFFNQPEEEGQEQPEFRTEGLGSGVIVEKNGNTYYVVTNDHVIAEADTITVELDDGRSFEAEQVGTDPRKDLAMVSFESDDGTISVARLGDSDNLHVGDWVLAVGSPFGFQSTVTAGIVSALGRRGGPQGNISDFIQTDAAINQGNSGGALVNMSGEVVGINTWITSRTGGSVGLGFSIPINNAKSTINDLVTEGEAIYGWLGVSIQSPPEAIAEQLGVAGEDGALVYHVFLNSPADEGGLQPGDFITSINGHDVADHDELILRVGELPVGETATFEVIRNGQERTVSTTIGRRQQESQIAEASTRLWPGASVFPLNEQVRGQVDAPVDDGVVVTSVEQNTPVSSAGLRAGDVITEINGSAIEDVRDFFTAINDDTDTFDVTFYREGAESDTTVSK
jgi:Do/DeqQ family serine protease